MIAADRLPMDLESLDERIRSRLAGGLAVEIATLDDELAAQDPEGARAGAAEPAQQLRRDAEVLAHVAAAVATNGAT